MNILRFNNVTVPYTINKAFANSMCISVQGNDVVVNAPWYIRKKYIQEVINEKKQWIISKLNNYDSKNIVNKGIVSLLGNDYILYIKYKNISNSVINIDKDSINVILPNKYKRIDDTYVSNMLINKIYERVASEELDRAMEKTRLLLGIAPEDYSVSNIKGNVIAEYVRESKKIVFDRSISSYSRDVIDYIVLHEFLHINYKVHCKGFWEIINKYCPNYKKYEEILKEKKY